MHERERHKLILSAVQERPVATIGKLVEMTATSEATIRRDISALHVQGRLRRVRGGAEALHPPQFVGIAGRPFKVSEAVNVEKKRAIAEAAVTALRRRRFHHHERRHDDVPDGAFPCKRASAGDDQLVRDCRAPDQNTRNNVMVPGGLIYREQAAILSPFEDDVSRNFFADRMFMGAQGSAGWG